MCLFIHNYATTSHCKTHLDRCKVLVEFYKVLVEFYH